MRKETPTFIISEKGKPLKFRQTAWTKPENVALVEAMSTVLANELVQIINHPTNESDTKQAQIKAWRVITKRVFETMDGHNMLGLLNNTYAYQMVNYTEAYAHTLVNWINTD